MKNKDEIILIDLFIHNDSELIKKWFENMKFFVPQKMCATLLTKGNHKKYNERIFFSNVDKEFGKEKFNVSYYEENSAVSVIRNRDFKNITIISANLQMDLYKEKEEEISILINEIMDKSGIVGRIIHFDDYFWQNNTDKNYYSLHNKSLDKIPLKKVANYQNKEVIDVEKLPGYEEVINNIWFGAAWKMWFAPSYNEYVSEEILINYTDCYQKEKFPSGCIYINLYENINDYDEPINRELQWKFKKAIDFDEVVDTTRKNKRHKSPGPETEIKVGHFSHGGVKLFRVYLDSNGHNVPKNRATKVRVIEYDKSGKVVWSEVREIEFNSMWGN